MKITITPTEYRGESRNGEQVRAWRGTTDEDTPVLVFVTAVATDETHFDRLLREVAGITPLENPSVMLPGCPIPLLAPEAAPATATPSQPQPEDATANVPL